MVEFLQDLIEKDPSQEFPQHEFLAGKSVLRTGDTVADAWAREIAEGKTPDFMASFDAEDQAKIQKLLKAAKKSQQVEPSKPQLSVKPESPKAEDFEFPPEGFHDDYVKEKRDG